MRKALLVLAAMSPALLALPAPAAAFQPGALPPSGAVGTPEGGVTAVHYRGECCDDGYYERRRRYYPRAYYAPRYYARRYYEPRYYEPRYYEPRYYEPRYYEPRYYEPRYLYYRAPRYNAPPPVPNAYYVPPSVHDGRYRSDDYLRWYDW